MQLCANIHPRYDGITPAVGSSRQRKGVPRQKIGV